MAWLGLLYKIFNEGSMLGIRWKKGNKFWLDRL